ncbi:hypothetical protein GVAV_000206 [Gurleya vavrai]
MNITSTDTRIEFSQLTEDDLISAYNKCLNLTRIFYIIYGLLSLHQFFFWKTDIEIFIIYLFFLAFCCFALLLGRNYLNVIDNDKLYYGISLYLVFIHIANVIIDASEIFTNYSKFFLMYIPSFCLASMILVIYLLDKYTKYNIPMPDYVMEKIEQKQHIIIPFYVCLTLILYYGSYYLQSSIVISYMLRYIACNTFTPIVIYLCYINYSNRNKSKNFMISALLLIIYTLSTIEQNYVFDNYSIIAN